MRRPQADAGTVARRLRALLSMSAAVMLAAVACGGDPGHEARTTGTMQTVAAPEATTIPVESRSAPHPPPFRETYAGFARQQVEDGTPDERLTAVANAQLPMDVDVWCWQEDAWSELGHRMNREFPQSERVEIAGFADLEGLYLHLAPWVCGQLASFGTTTDDAVTADALLVLAHEIRHFSPTGSNEAATECAALQRVEETAAALGASVNRAERLARIAWEDLYPANSLEYRSDECRPGGTLDEEPATSAFP
jgi:hypothetical protein